MAPKIPILVVYVSLEHSGIVSGTELTRTIVKMSMEQCTCDNQRFARVGISVRHRDSSGG